MTETIRLLVIYLGAVLAALAAWHWICSRNKKKTGCQHERIWLDSLYIRHTYESQTDYYVRLECSACPLEWEQKVSSICSRDLAMQPIPRYIDAKEIK